MHGALLKLDTKRQGELKHAIFACIEAVDGEYLSFSGRNARAGRVSGDQVVEFVRALWDYSSERPWHSMENGGHALHISRYVSQCRPASLVAFQHDQTVLVFDPACVAFEAMPTSRSEVRTVFMKLQQDFDNLQAAQAEGELAWS